MSFDWQRVMGHFQPDQGLADIVPGFRAREEQRRLARAVCEALDNSEFLLAEVGTGVGKTFAYLVPAVFWSLYTGERVVISTKTKALQKQISEKDMPDVSRLVQGGSVNWVEAKGRENYLCWNKYIGILSGRRSLDQEESRFISSILAWAESTVNGDRQELNINSKLMRYWELIAADRGSCLRDRCTFREKCFRLKLTKKMEQANIIITNHALLLSDLVIDNRILPEYHCLVVDEAHNLDREAFDKLSYVFSAPDVNEILSRLGGDFAKHDHGLLPAIRKHYPELEEECLENEHHIIRIKELSRSFFAGLAGIKRERSLSAFSVVMDEYLFEKQEFYDLSTTHLEWQEQTSLLLTGLKNLRESITGQAEENDLVTYISMLKGTADTAYHVMEESINHEDYLHWIEYSAGQPVSICSSPVGMSDLLHERLYSKLASLVMVSATMTVNRSFDYSVEHLGLEIIRHQERLNTLLEDSPFPYKQQACLFCVSDMPDPDSRGFNPQSADVLKELVEISSESTMVLFTSRQQLAEVSHLVRQHIEEKGANLLVQNEDGDFTALLTQFTSSNRSILMGLDTFWEGIDLRGELLRCLIIVKLPFRPPSEPFTSACLKDCQLKGKNGFKNFSLPDAAIRFKQGIGRLIRSEEDYGAVIILDPRILSKPYGRTFLSSVPMQNIKAVKKADLPAELIYWLGDHPFSNRNHD